ncbi:MAG: Lpg1974 family pore-forming outer membrane protein [Parcubacteria group bacterium]
MLVGSACAIALTTGGMAAAQTRDFDVPAGDLSVALDTYARQSGIQIIYRIADVTGVHTQGAKGALSTDEALAQLLEGTRFKVRRDPSGAIAIADASAPQSGSAAGDGADAGTVQALVVTAQKREENIQDVPIAMSAFTQEDLTRSQVAGGPDLMTQVPNFTFTKTNFSGYSIQIRGIGTQAISATTDAAVAVALNNTPFIRNRFFEQEFYDLQRVEVLRGPQGTLYGRNATAGVVNIITAKPKFTYEAKLSADVGNYNSTRLEGMINLPLVKDKVAVRLAGAWTKREGYDTNQITGNPIDGRDLWSTRLTLRVAPTDKIDANLIWEHFQEDDDRLRSGKQLCRTDDREQIGGNNLTPLLASILSQGCLTSSLYSPDSFQVPNGLSLPYYDPLAGLGLPIPGSFGNFNPYASTTQSRDLRTIESTVDPHYRAKSDVAELQWRAELGEALTLASETAYGVDFVFSTEDFNRFNTAHGAFTNDYIRWGGPREGLLTPGEFGGVFCDPQIGCSDRLVAVDLSTARSRQFSQEFRLASDFDGAMNFSVGANFLRYDTEDKYYVFFNTLSLYAALAQYNGDGLSPQAAISPWVPGLSDNRECLPSGLQAPDPNGFSYVNGCIYIDPNPIDRLNDQGHNYFLSRNPYKLISYALFGEVYYDLAPDLKVTAGLRWTVDKKEAPRIPSWVLASGSAGYPVAEVVRQRWSEPTGRLALDWKPDLSLTDETLLYASYAHGYKAGGTNPPTAGTVVYGDVKVAQARTDLSATKPRTFEPEFVDAFEIGTKNTLDDSHLTLNATAFFYNYKGYQISQIVDRSAVNYNFDAKVWGLEFEGAWRPMENLQVGLKLGYEQTRVADGSRAIDIMDRTAGRSDWMVVRPFPTFTSNCVLPTYVMFKDPDTSNFNPALFITGNMGPCEFAYLLNKDPVTRIAYNPNDHVTGDAFGNGYPGYAGFDPAVDYGNNHGEGFYKDLSGHELPNAPHYTATLTTDYTLPLPSDWLMTLHTDLYYQSEAWTRIFNTEGYDKLKAYTNVNLAAIFTNEDAGWKVMAYVKNVFDRDSITGAFLNSDDTGLTTNVFLTEPRLYGLRVTKEWTGAQWWTAANHTGPFPLMVEVNGTVVRQDAPYAALTPSFTSDLPDALRPRGYQNTDLDRGDERGVKLTYRFATGWQLSASARFGRASSGKSAIRTESDGIVQCGFGEPLALYCSNPPPGADADALHDFLYPTVHNWADAHAQDHEEHTAIEFAVGRDAGFGALDRSSISAGLRYAGISSDTEASLSSMADWYLPQGWRFRYDPLTQTFGPADATAIAYSSTLTANRHFEGAGPVFSWNGAKRLVGKEETGKVEVEWTAAAGVLFGRQSTAIEGSEEVGVFSGQYEVTPRVLTGVEVTPVNLHRSSSVSVPVLDLSLGLSYDIQRIKVSTGYRWERYFNAIDGGYAEHKSFDRTIDGPYFKIAVGFGG